MDRFPFRESDDGGVDEARAIVADLIHAEIKRGESGTRSKAMQAVARVCRVRAANVRQLWDESRRPKDISLRLWRRLCGGYAAYLRREIATLENRLRALEHMENIDPGALQTLAADAESFNARLRRCLNQLEG